jgi:hypothetical protein
MFSGASTDWSENSNMRKSELDMASALEITDVLIHTSNSEYTDQDHDSKHNNKD